MLINSIDEYKKVGYYHLMRRAVYILLTDKCNFNCNGCYLHNDSPFGAMPKEKIIYSLDLAQALIRKDIGKNAISIFGGEPFLEFESVKFTVEEAKKRGLITTAFTNGFWGNSLEFKAS